MRELNGFSRMLAIEYGKNTNAFEIHEKRYFEKYLDEDFIRIILQSVRLIDRRLVVSFSGRMNEKLVRNPGFFA